MEKGRRIYLPLPAALVPPLLGELVGPHFYLTMQDINIFLFHGHWPSCFFVSLFGVI